MVFQLHLADRLNATSPGLNTNPLGELIFFVPRTPANVLRSLGVRHQELADESHILADKLENALRGQMDAHKLRDLNMCWSRGEYWCRKFASEENPLNMPGQVLAPEDLKPSGV